MAAPPSVGTSLPSINGQSVNTSCASLALTYVPTNRRSPTTAAVTRASRENDRASPLMAPPSRASRGHGGACRDVRHVRDQEQGDHEVRGHPPGVQVRGHDHGAEPRLRHHEREREDRRPEHRRVSTLRADRGETGERREHRHEERHPSVRELDERMDGPRREEATRLAARPGGAPEAGARPSHESPDREQHDRGDRRGEREGAEAGTGVRHGDARMIVAASEGAGLAILPLVTTDLRARVDAALAAFLDARRDQVAAARSVGAPPGGRGPAARGGRGQADPTGLLLLGVPGGRGERRRADRARRGLARAPAHDGAGPRRPDRRSEGATRGSHRRPCGSPSARPSSGRPAIHETSAARWPILVGDVSAVWADGLLSASGFSPDVPRPGVGRLPRHAGADGGRAVPGRRAARRATRRSPAAPPR